MERKFSFSENEFYHIYNRGNNKQLIFLDEKDKIRFKKLLYVCNSVKPVVYKTIQGLPLDKIDRGETLVDLGVYCLMPNHFHLLLHEKTNGGISKFLEKLSTAYSMYFNKKFERTGGLFENTFKAKHVDDDNHLKYLFSYIHLNPIKLIDPEWKENGIKDINRAKVYLEKYQDSSYLDYIGVLRQDNLIINRQAFPEYFQNVTDFEESIDNWLEFK